MMGIRVIVFVLRCIWWLRILVVGQQRQGNNNKMPIYIPVAARGSVWVCLWMWLWLSCGILGNIDKITSKFQLKLKDRAVAGDILGKVLKM
jgi:hypothetical protein